jgi:hypothetical protein
VLKWQSKCKCLLRNAFPKAKQSGAAKQSHIQPAISPFPAARFWFLMTSPCARQYHVKDGSQEEGVLQRDSLTLNAFAMTNASTACKSEKSMPVPSAAEMPCEGNGI